MKTINRRRFLGSLAVSTVCAGVARADIPQPAKLAMGEQENVRNNTWFIARQNRELRGQHIIDFWSKPLCDIDHANYLPPEIVRGTLWYDGAGTDFQEHPALKYVDSILEQDRSIWLYDKRLFAEHCPGMEGLSVPLLTMVGQKASTSRGGRTALLALDSQWLSTTDPDWADMLPAFRRCYDRVIGHFHIERRGFHHWKKWLSDGTFGDSFFEHFFTKTALQCDAIILTSQSLAEHDAHLSPRASTEALVGELIRRLGDALLDENVLEQIAPISTPVEKRAVHPRVFALGSAGASVSYPRVREIDLCHQRELVYGSFGKPILCPLLIATRCDTISAEYIRNQISGYNFLFLATLANSGRWRNGKYLEYLEFVTLWPFDPDYGPWF